MARVSAELVVAGGSAAAVMCPRDGIVLEAVESRASDGTSASFRQAEGLSPPTGGPSRSSRSEAASTEPAR